MSDSFPPCPDTGNLDELTLVAPQLTPMALIIWVAILTSKLHLVPTLWEGGRRLEGRVLEGRITLVPVIGTPCDTAKAMGFSSIQQYRRFLSS